MELWLTAAYIRTGCSGFAFRELTGQGQNELSMHAKKSPKSLPTMEA